MILKAKCKLSSKSKNIKEYLAKYYGSIFDEKLIKKVKKNIPQFNVKKRKKAIQGKNTVKQETITKSRIDEENEVLDIEIPEVIDIEDSLKSCELQNLCEKQFNFQFGSFYNNIDEGYDKGLLKVFEEQDKAIDIELEES